MARSFITDESRNLDQNARMWAMLGDIAKQVPWPVMIEGRIVVQKIDAESWKDILSAGLEKQQRMAQGVDGGWVLLGLRTSRLSKAKFAQLVDLILMFGDSHQVRWSDPKWIAEQAA